MTKPRPWTREEQQKAKDLIEQGFTYKETAEVLTKEFGHKRTYSMVRRQVRNGNVKANKTIKDFNKNYTNFSNENSSSSSLTEKNNYATIEGNFKEKKTSNAG